jgi:hypothetical protein
MPVDRELVTNYLTADHQPVWRCPKCESDQLALVPGSLQFAMTSESDLSRDEEWFDAHHVEYRFSALLKCRNVRCLEAATIAGTGDVMEWQDERTGERNYQDQFRPTFFQPSPTLIEVPPRCPPAVSQQLRAAYAASWGDYSAAGNHIRTAAELLLDALKVRKTKTTKAGKLVRLPLHGRLELLKDEKPDVHDSLLAIKWIGNAGSHQALTRDNVFDALDIFESVLITLYAEHPRALKRIVAQVNKRRGPRKPARR